MQAKWIQRLRSRRTVVVAVGLVLLLTLFWRFPTVRNLPPRETERYAETVEVALNEAKMLDNDRLGIRVTDIQDSRCPQDAQCAWPGDVTVELILSDPSGVPEKTLLSLHATREGQEMASNQGYEIKLTDVQPEPAIEAPVTAADYRVTLDVRKGD